MDALKGSGKKRNNAANRDKKQSVAEAGLRFIEGLYLIERSVADASIETRLQVRKEKSLPIVAKPRAWLDASVPTVPPKSLTGVARSYLDKQWKTLVPIFDYGHVSLDTNLVQIAIRPFAVGRKNWIFAKTVRGAKASANLYRLIETAKANGIDPCAYLTRVFRDLPRPVTVGEVEARLPGPLLDRKDGGC